MVDIIPHAAGLLAPTGAQIELSWSDTYTTFPLIVLSVAGNTGTVCDGKEVFTSIVLQVDVYTYDAKQTKDLADVADGILTAGGFKRSNAIPMKEGDFERMQMSYNVYIDYTHNRIMMM